MSWNYFRVGKILIFFPHGNVIRQQIFIACLALLFKKHAFIPSKKRRKNTKIKFTI